MAWLEMPLLIKNGRVITAEKDFYADIYIEKEIIAAIGDKLDFTADKIIDAAGKYVIPGGIDVHTHLDMPYGKIKSSDDFESGTIAAAFGGTTSIIDYATQTRGTRIESALEQWHKKAEGKACVDYGFHMIVTDLSTGGIDSLDTMLNEGVTSFKLFTAYPNSLMVDDDTILQVLRFSKEKGALVCVHAEDGIKIEELIKRNLAEGKKEPIYHALSRPAVTEANAVEHVINLSQKAGAPVYIVHLSSDAGLQKIIEARNRGAHVYAETCPQYLSLSLEDMNKPGFENAKYVFTPPLREKFNLEKLWGGIRNNFIQTIATDHCPFNFKNEKELGLNDFSKIPNGAPGIETRMHLIYDKGVNSGKISLNKWIDLTSTSPAKIFGLYPRKGTIALGSDADIVIWDPEKEFVISAETDHMNVDYSLYEGEKIIGNAETVISRGEIIIDKNRFTGRKGRGIYLRRDRFSLDS